MVFLIQNSQNRGDRALSVKVDELIRSTEKARNDLIGLEQKTEKDIAQAAEEVQKAVVEETAAPVEPYYLKRLWARRRGK
jgi:low affinity Fe/Cu permease